MYSNAVNPVMVHSPHHNESNKLGAWHLLPQHPNQLTAATATEPDPSASSSAAAAVAVAMSNLFTIMDGTNSSKPADPTDLVRTLSLNPHEAQDFGEFELKLLELCPRGAAAIFQYQVTTHLKCLNPNFPYDSSNTVTDLIMYLSVDDDFDTARQAYQQKVTSLVSAGEGVRVREGGEKQDVERQASIQTPPAVFQFCLNRFASTASRTSKKDNRFEFPTGFPFDASHSYHLFAVVAHAGQSFRRGHYTAFIRPICGSSVAEYQQSKLWYKFDDTKAKEVTEDKAVRENFGGKKGAANAYALFYLRANTIAANQGILQHQSRQMNRGVVNKGETCALAAVLQVYYHLPILRAAIDRSTPSSPSSSSSSSTYDFAGVDLLAPVVPDSHAF